jgi:ABC-type dipeptide/oligopeptide/nickel transport system permease subunit
LIGAISGFYGGWLDTILMRFVEFMLTIRKLAITADHLRNALARMRK